MKISIRLRYILTIARLLVMAQTGSGNCRTCHSQQYNDWKDSYHDLAMADANVESVKGDFDTTFFSQGVTNRFFRKDNRYFVNTEGPDGAYHDYEVIYTFGVPTRRRTIIFVL